MEILGGFREKKAVSEEGSTSSSHGLKKKQKIPQKNLPKSWKMAPPPKKKAKNPKKIARWGRRNFGNWGNFGNFRGIPGEQSVHKDCKKKKNPKKVKKNGNGGGEKREEK